MIEIKGNRRGFAAFFEGYQWIYLVDAILEESIVSRVLADDESNPRVSALELSNIKLYITGGDARHPSARDFFWDYAFFCPGQEDIEHEVIAKRQPKQSPPVRNGLVNQENPRGRGDRHAEETSARDDSCLDLCSTSC